MKNEEFDDAIRKKLESVEQNYTEADVEKAFRYVSKKRPAKMKWLRGAWPFIALSAAAMVGVTTWVVVRNNGNISNDLAEKQVNNNEIATQANDKTASDAETKMITADTTTLLIEKQFDKTQTPSISNKQETKANIITPASGRKITRATQPTASMPPTATVGSSSISTAGVPITEPLKAISLNENIVKDTVQFVAHQNDVPESLLVAGKQDRGENAAAQQPDTSHNISSNLDSVIPKSVQQAKPLSLAGIRLNAGVPISNQSFGAGFGGELLLGEHAGLSAGLRFSRTYTETFFTKEILAGHKHDRMGPDFHKHFAGDDVFIDISVRNSILQLPVALSYYIPLKQGFKLNFSVGTDFDLHVKQNIDYTSPFDSAGMRRIHFNAQGKVTPVNTLYISLGFEKRWDRLALQVSPFLNPHLKQVFYKPKEIDYGVNVGLSYSLWKK